MHGIPIDQLTPADLSDELERVAELGAGSLTHLRALWRKATARGIALRYITVDPAVNLRVPATTISPETHTYKNGASRPLKNSLTNEQLATLREKVRIRHPQQRLDMADLIILGTYTGLRINEASSLRGVDVHLGDERSFLTVRGQVYGSGKTREWRPMLKRDSSRRTVPLPPAAAEIAAGSSARGAGRSAPGCISGSRVRVSRAARWAARSDRSPQGCAPEARPCGVPAGHIPYPAQNGGATAHGRGGRSSRHHVGHGA